MPKISVIIPVFNVAQYLERCLDSLINQTLKDIEIICIDDCSTDESLTILRNYEKQDSRIKVIAFDTKQNAAIARNAGLKVATGKYLGFVDSDDFVDLDFYEKLYQKAVETGADIVKANTLIVNVDGTSKKSNLNDVIRQNKMNFLGEWWSAIYQHDMIKKKGICFPEECPKAQDIVFLNRCLLQANKFEVLDNCFYHYIRRKSSLDSERLSDIFIESEMCALNLILTELNNNYPNNVDKDGYINAYGTRCRTFIESYFKTDSQEMKHKELTYLIAAYKICQRKDSFWNSFKFISLKSAIQQDNAEKIKEKLDRCKNFHDFDQNEFLYSLRNKIKGDV